MTGSQPIVPISHVGEGRTARVTRRHLLGRQEAKGARPSVDNEEPHMATTVGKTYHAWVLAPQTMADSPSPDCKN
jgi:hypothetical protein